ncbi:MAG TPA: TIGR03620 family F420-dependent LLM class oxidoreductase [Acidimicrobiales bacterium]|nr:TIGR03620 family F420-dependent LLM class oxidoreductase [Acidimicrobiales bacterium]
MREITTTGVWTHTETMSGADAVALAQRIEALGYSTLWLPETAGKDPFALIGMLAANTTELRFATGIANIFHRHPGVMKQAAMTLAEQSGGRFILGIGVSHGPMVAGLRGLDYSKPLASMSAYLDGYDASPYMAFPPAEPPKRVLAALGPKMLELARDKADGAHPYWTTPDHTALARKILGPDKLLLVEQKVVGTTDADKAHAAAIGAVNMYRTLPNYRNNWLRLGFTDEEIDANAARFLDAVVAWGTTDQIKARIQEHIDAGADQVCVQPLDPENRLGFVDWDVLESLKP